MGISRHHIAGADKAPDAACPAFVARRVMILTGARAFDTVNPM